MLERCFIFIKAQISSFIGGAVDYGLMIYCTEVFHIHYTLSIMIGGIIGALINFCLNKEWVFHSKGLPYKFSCWSQLKRFVVMVINSIAAKSAGTFLFTNFTDIDYKISRLIVDLFVSIFLNFNLQKNWIFKKQPVTGS